MMYYVLFRTCVRRPLKVSLFSLRRLSSVNRKGFGSFHSEDIEVLIRKDDLDLTLYSEVSGRTTTLIENKYGAHFDLSHSKNMFLIDKYNFMNHGAFGAVLEPLLYEATNWRYEIEKQPLKFFDRELFTLVAYSLQQMAKFIHCPATELLPLQNVTTGLNSVFNSITLAKGDEVICLSLTYGSTKKMLQDLCNRSGAILKIIPFTLPIQSNEQVIETICAQVDRAKTKLIVIDHITSNTAMILPVVEIASKCKQITNGGAVIVVDAAHSLMAQDVAIYPRNMSVSSSNSYVESKEVTVATTTPPSHTSSPNHTVLTPSDIIADVVDVWLTNGHKWLCAPKGCAFMWVSPQLQHRGVMQGGLRPAIISHGFAPVSVQSNIHTSGSRSIGLSDPNKTLSGFVWDGCRDYTAMICIPSALRIWQSSTNLDHNSNTLLSMSRIYMHNLLHQATDLLTHEWKLEACDFAAPYDMRKDSPMSLIPLPLTVQGINTRHATDNEAFYLQEQLYHIHKIEVPVKCLEGRLYVRISAHIYNTLSQYEELAYVIKNIGK